jgi:hypothetical protein
LVAAIYRSNRHNIFWSIFENCDNGLLHTYELKGVGVCQQSGWTTLVKIFIDYVIEIKTYTLEEKLKHNTSTTVNMTETHITLSEYFTQCEEGTALTIETSMQLDEYGVEFYNATERHTNRTPLFISASKGHLQNVTLLLNWNAFTESVTGDKLNTPLIEATENGHISIVKALLQNGANFDHTDIEGSTALHIAVQYNQIEIVKYLLIREESINAMDNQGFTALHLACQTLFHDTLQLPELIATHSTSEVDLKNRFGSTPLHNACQMGRLEVVSMLIRNNHGIHHLDDDNQTCFQAYGDWVATMNDEDKQLGREVILKDSIWHRRKNWAMCLSSIKNVSHNICIQNDTSTIHVTQEMEVTNHFFTTGDVVQRVGKYL